MNKYIFALIVLSSCIGCRQSTSQNGGSSGYESDIRELVAEKSYLFSIDNNINSFGYKVFSETGEINSITDLKIVGNYSFLVDPVNGNIKRVDLSSGDLLISEMIDSDSSWLYSIEYFNELLYVFTFKGTVFLLDKTLKNRGSFFIPDFIGDVHVFTVNEDSLVIYRNPTDIVGMKESKFLIRTVLDDSNRYSFDTIQLNNEDYLSLLRKEKELNLNDNEYLVTNNWRFELPERIEIKNNYDCQALDFSEDYIVFYNVNSDQFELVVWEYVPL